MKRAFTLLEVVVIITIIGILATIVYSRLTTTREDAVIVSLKAQYKSIQNAIRLELRKQLLKGDISGIKTLEISGGPYLFGRIIKNGIKGNKDTTKLISGWNLINNTTYKACINGKNCTQFTYNPSSATTSSTTKITDSASFTCDTAEPLCKSIIK